MRLRSVAVSKALTSLDGVAIAFDRPAVAPDDEVVELLPEVGLAGVSSEERSISAMPLSASALALRTLHGDERR
jgi:hypothetical protein